MRHGRRSESRRRGNRARREGRTRVQAEDIGMQRGEAEKRSKGGERRWEGKGGEQRRAEEGTAEYLSSSCLFLH